MSRELCACFVDDDCVLLYIKQARVVDSMLYKDNTEHWSIVVRTFLWTFCEAKLTTPREHIIKGLSLESFTDLRNRKSIAGL